MRNLAPPGCDPMMLPESMEDLFYLDESQVSKPDEDDYNEVDPDDMAPENEYNSPSYPQSYRRKRSRGRPPGRKNRKC